MKALPTPKNRRQWEQALAQNEERMEFLTVTRGLSVETIEGAQLGWDGSRYCLPVFGVDGTLLNVRRYSSNADYKMISLAGHGTPRLYVPCEAQDEAVPVLVVEGELDCLKAGQELDDYWVVSGTGGAGSPPKAEELEPLRGRVVVIAYDCDEAGRRGAEKMAERLAGIAAEVRVADLGLDDAEDVTDWFVTHRKSAASLRKVLEAAPLAGGPSTADRRDADELLTIALREKVDAEGSRNAAGFWLACQLRDERYSATEAEPVMLRFAEAARAMKRADYPDNEAMDSLRSAYGAVRRDAVGKVGATYGYDDIGNGQRLADGHGADMRYVEEFGGWHVWDGRRWTKDDTGRVERWAKETARAMKREAQSLLNSDQEPTRERGKALMVHATRSASASKLGAMMSLAQSEDDRTTMRSLRQPASAFDADPRVLVCQNGTLELGDRVTFRDHDRADLATRVAAARYDEAATARRWEAFLREALPDEAVRSYLQRLTAYAALTVGNPRRLLPFLIGPTSSGKSTFGEVVLTALGDYAGPFELSLLRSKHSEGPRPDLVASFSRRLLFTTEASQGWELHADAIKRFTGNDSISVRTLHSRSYLTGVPAFTPMIATNTPPQISGADQALWRRLTVVPFAVSFAGREDDSLRATVEATELDGVLRWLVEGWNALQADGLEPPDAVVVATLALRSSLHSVDAWLDEWTDAEATAKTLFSDLWDSFRTWQVESGTPERSRLTMQGFTAALDGRGFGSTRGRDPGADRRSDRKVTYRTGIRLLHDAGRVRSGGSSAGS